MRKYGKIEQFRVLRKKYVTYVNIYALYREL